MSFAVAFALGSGATAQDSASSSALIAPASEGAWAKMISELPDHGFVLYNQDGVPVKAFGPNTPVFTENGLVKIPGIVVPQGGELKTEDGPTYFQALETVTAAKDPPPDSDYSRGIRQVVDAIDSGAAYVQANLCKHPARPSKIQVELLGGFSFGVYGSIKSTVDWDLEKVCADTTPQ